jgi:glycerol kinase
MSVADGLIVAVDQGTSSTKAMLVDSTGDVRATSAVAVGQSHPHPGWVEQDPGEIWHSVHQSIADLVAPELVDRVIGLALSVQRESLVIWEHETGRAVSPILGWQDERAKDLARDLHGYGAEVFSITGLPLDPMFSALKARWLLDRLDPDRTIASSGRWRLGTLDAWLLAQFGGDSVTEIGNASRTQLLNVEAGTWDDYLLDLFGIPRVALPRVVSSLGPFPSLRDLGPLPDGLPVLAVLGDSHAALFAQAGWRPGVVKATYGTGSSVMALGSRLAESTGVCTTIAWRTEDTALALEANIRSTGRTVTWLADLLGADVETLIAEAAIDDSDGITLVPAFGGLGAPWWDAEATPVLAGFALGTRRSSIARAALESVAFQVDDVLTAFRRSGVPVAQLECDGGLTRSSALMQLQSDLSGVPVRVAETENLSALGVVHLAGLAAGLWTPAELEARVNDTARILEPRMGEEDRAAARDRWSDALARSSERCRVMRRSPAVRRA